MIGKINRIKDNYCGIYFLKIDDKVVYIGQSINMKSRLKNHYNDPFKVFNNLNIKHVKDKSIINDIEAEYIKYHDPIFNTIHSSQDSIVKIINDKTKEIVSNMEVKSEKIYIDVIKSSETEDECYKPTITKGWRIMYALNYDEVFMEMSSKTDKLVFLEVRDSFKKDRKEVSFNQTEMAKKLKSTRQTVNKIFKRLEKIDCLLKLDNGSYRLNPYCYIPFAADGVKLQNEWDELTNNESMREIIDEIKNKTKQ